MKKFRFRGFFSGARGQRVFNILYSIGASIVILGALFKILHFDVADIMLIIGMGTEAVIFFLSAFDEKTVGSGEAPGLPEHERERITKDLKPETLKPETWNMKPETQEDLQREMERLTDNIKQLNAIYERMLKAMKEK